MEEKVSVKRLNFYYGAYRALSDINVNLLKNKVTAFIGPSGCGKSTLLRILNRIYDLYPNQRADGEVMLDGENILSPKQDLNLLRAKVGMVFQKPTPFPMTIYDNIAFGVRLYDQLSKAELDARVQEVAASAPRCGTRSRTSSTPAASASQAASSRGCASPAPWPSGRRSFCSTSPARRSTRSRPPRSRS